MPQIPSTMSTPAVQIAQVVEENAAQYQSRAGVASANPPSTSLPASVKLESDAPPPIPSTGKVPFMNPVETPRAAEAARTVNNTPPNMSVNLREDFINEAVGSKPLAPNLIVLGGVGQEQTNARPDDSDEKLTGTNPVGSGPLIVPQPPTVVTPIVAPPSPEGNFE